MATIYCKKNNNKPLHLRETLQTKRKGEYFLLILLMFYL